MININDNINKNSPNMTINKKGKISKFEENEEQQNLTNMK